MQTIGGISRQDLSLFGSPQAAEGGAFGFGSRMLDSDGDGRVDLFLLDFDNDGTIDNVVRGFDADGDGVNDTFVSYNEDGTIESVGRLNPATGEIEVIWEEPGFFEELLAALGLIDLQSPEEALFTSFNDPYIYATFGTYGEEVPLEPVESLIAEPADILEDDTGIASEIEGATVVEAADTTPDVPSSETEAAQEPSGQEAGAETASSETEGSAEPEAKARVTELRDSGGGADSSTLWARVDRDGDSLADDEVLVTKVGDDYYADINRDGVSRDIGTDIDHDGRIDTVDTTGQGSSTDTVDASTVVSPESAHWADQPGEDDAAVEVTADVADAAPTVEIDDADASAVSAEPYDAPDSYSAADTSSDVGTDTGATTTVDTYDSASSYDSGGTTET